VATQVVQMDYGVITEVSKGFSVAAQMLKTVSKVLGILINILRATAFFSMGTSLALANYLENIQRAIDNLAKVLDEFAGDLSRAVTDHKRGDYKGKTYFGEGVSS
jgi:hypothetical protein